VGTWVSALEVPAVGTLQPASIGLRFMAGKIKAGHRWTWPTGL